MTKSGIFSGIYRSYIAGSKRETRHSGIVFGLICSVFLIFLMGGGFLTPLEDYFTTLIFQYDYKEPEVQSRIFIAKKDQATSELLGKNPGREEFASLFELLGQAQQLKRRGGGKARPFKFFSLKIGLFNDVRNPIIRNSLTDFCGVTEKIAEYFDENPQSEGYRSLVLIESLLFAYKSGNVLRTFAGPSGPFIMPSLGLIQLDDLVAWVDLDKHFKDNLGRAKENKPLFFPTVDDIAKLAKEGSEEFEDNQKTVENLLQRWQTLFEKLFKASLGIRFEFMPEENCLFEIALLNVFEPLPPTYYVDSSSVIAFDFILQGQKGEEVDQKLQDAIANSKSKVILAAHTKLEEEYETDSESYSLDDKMIDTYRKKKLVTRVIMPDQRFIASSSHLGMIDISTGNKSFVTQVPVFSILPEKGKLEPSFALVTAMSALEDEKPQGATFSYLAEMYRALEDAYPAVVSGTFKGPLKIGDNEIPVDENGRLYLKYYGSTSKNRFRKAAIPSVSFFECFTADFLQKVAENPSEISRKRLDRAHSRTMNPNTNKGGKVVMAGPFEMSDFDFYPTPLSMRTPFVIQSDPLMGVEIHANAVINILNRDYLRHPNIWQTLFAIIATSLLLGLILDFISPFLGALVTFIFMVAVTKYASFSYHELGQVFNFSALLIGYPTIWTLATLTNYLRQRAQAQNTKNMFSRFVAADVVQYMLENPELVRPGGQKVELTIFFSDVAGFTSISEALTPEELVVLLNEYLGAMTDLLFEYGGTLDKFIGDAVMAFWNYPKEQGDHAERACLCALAMQKKIHELQLGWAARGLPKVSARAGLNTAGVVVGYMGSNKAQMNFTCMGDGVNLASRLEGANKEYGTALMVSDATYQRAKNKVTARFLDFLAVKGKKEPVKVHELVCVKGQEPPDWAELSDMYNTAIQLHLDRKWEEAIATFEKILARWPDDGPSQTYLHRCHEYMQNPPPEGWDGRYILTHK
ncbi:MAG: adenylate/guanylate cyclase domain-containing protein [Candidatus Rifleibacteriota bacterium]